MHDDERGLTALLREMRTDVPVRPQWRDALRARLDDEARSIGRHPSQGRERQSRQAVTLRPIAAIAASVALVAVGAIAGSVLVRQRGVASSAPAVSLVATTHDDGAPSFGAVGVRFAVVAPGVQRVALVGDFNGWNPAATPLRRERDGQTWSILLPLPQGRHTYAFVIDGTVVADPTAPSVVDEDFGTPSSLVLVSRELP